MKCLILALYIFIILPISVCSQTAREVIEKSEEKMRGLTSQCEITLRTIRPNWSRSFKIKAWLKGNDYSMLLVTAPARDKGIVYLKRKKEVWNWIPSIEKVIKLPPSMMSQSWMGTDFSNDDLVKESSLLKDYSHSFFNDTIINGRLCYKIILIPLSGATVVWGKLIICIDKERSIQLHIQFYDEDNVLINTMNADEVKIMDNRLIPTHFEIIPADKPNQKTEMVYESVLFNRNINDEFFSTNQMKYLIE
ncbi:MAG: outer membrane lipoprotein-sorting protein [Ferruginibacter sp.]|nr:outer membrane lipoprotein-sorting protein [Ferruginibacter sp.]